MYLCMYDVHTRQHETIDNLALHLQMLEKMYVFMDWQKVGELVEQSFADTSEVASITKVPPGLGQSENANELVQADVGKDTRQLLRTYLRESSVIW